MKLHRRSTVFDGKNICFCTLEMIHKKVEKLNVITLLALAIIFDLWSKEADICFPVILGLAICFHSMKTNILICK